MQHDRFIKFIDIMIVIIGLVSIIVLILIGLNDTINETIDISLIPIILIIAYTGLTGIKIILKGNRRLGFYLVFFSLIVISVRMILMIVIR